MILTWQGDPNIQNILSKFAADLYLQIRDALRAYPVEIGLGIFVALVFQKSLNGHGSDFINVFFPTILIWLAVFAISCLHGLGALTRNMRIGLTTAILVVGVTWSFGFFDPDLNSHIWRWLLLATGLTSAVMITPLMAKDRSVPREVRFWRLNARLITRFAVCGFYVTCLYVGLILALLATSALFGLGPAPELMAIMGGWLFAGLGP